MMQMQNNPEGTLAKEFKRASARSILANAWRTVVVALVLPIVQQFENLDWKILDDLVNLRIWDPETGEVTAIAIIVGMFLVLLVLGSIAGVWHWAFTKYLITPKTVYLQSGLFWRKNRQVPVNRIQSVEVHRPLQAQVFGLAKLHIESAGGLDSAVSLEFLGRKEAEALAQLLRTYAKGGAISPAEQPLNMIGESHGDNAVANGMTEAVDTVGVPPGADLPKTSAVTHQSARFASPQLAGQSNGTGQPDEFTGVGSLDEHQNWVDDAIAHEKPIPIAKVDTLRLVVGGICSSKLIKSFSAFLVVAVIVLVGWYFAVPEQSGFQSLVLLLGALFTFLTMISNDWHGQTVLKGKNLQISGGLTNKVTQSTPVSRIHGVIVEQSLIWALFDWWNGQIAVAGRQLASDEKKHSTKDSSAVVVGKPQAIKRLIWATLPDLGTDQADRLIREGMYGTRNTGNWLKPQPCSWFRQPFSWFRLGLMVTEKAMLVRTGLVERRLTVLPLKHVQQVALKRGPINRLCGTSVLIIRGVHSSRVAELRIRGIAESEALAVQRYLEKAVKANLRPLGEKPMATQRELMG